MKNNEITLIRGNYTTSGQQNYFQTMKFSFFMPEFEAVLLLKVGRPFPSFKKPNKLCHPGNNPQRLYSIRSANIKKTSEANEQA